MVNVILNNEIHLLHLGKELIQHKSLVKRKYLFFPNYFLLKLHIIKLGGWQERTYVMRTHILTTFPVRITTEVI